MFPIKYIDNNLVWNKDNEVFAYYELIPYNYSFLSAEQKFIVHDSFRQLIAQSREGKIHALQIATESSVRSIQEQSKRLVTGRLRDVAIQKIDEQTEALVSMIEGAFLKYFGIPVALTWFMSQKTFDGKKPYSFLKSQITYALRPKITYAGKAVKLHKQTLNETITAVRSVNYVPDKIY